jgi:hypothetical protein
MPLTYDRNLRAPRAYQSTAVVGREGHNPQITYYYGNASGTELVRVEERLQTATNEIHIWSQTISGSNYVLQWPSYDHYVVYEPWEESTTSGTL